MPTFSRENAQIWKELSDMDYFTQFIKAWLAFNAWMSNAYTGLHRDRNMIDHLKGNANPIRNKTKHLLEDEGNDGQYFRGLVADLHNQLENTPLIVDRRGYEKQITFRALQVRNSANHDNYTYRNRRYFLKRHIGAPDNGKVELRIVKVSDGSVVFEYLQEEYNVEILKAHPPFKRLSREQREKLLSGYSTIAPFREISFLASSGEDLLMVGSYSFKNDTLALAGAILEVIYEMRCLLFHGEIVPKRHYNRVYEPAYRIVKIWLEAI